jgi:hypothetical protein
MLYPKAATMKRMLLLLLLCLLISLPPAIAQKIKKVEGTAQVRMELNMTENDTRKLAEELAKIDALQIFGTIADQEFNMMIKEGKADYNIIAKTEVRGEWVETIDGPFFEEDFKKEKTDEGIRNVKWITCNIKGKGRELTPRAQIDFYPLNYPNLSNRTTEFPDEGNLYLYFKSPVDGYLSVFLDDGIATYRLLPDAYASKEFESGVLIEGDESYIFFSKKKEQNKLPQKKVEEYTMFTTEKLEYNYLYVVFSESRFVKPILNDIQIINGDTLPRSLPFKKFQDWITENKYANPTFQVRKMAITLKGN